MTTRITNMSPQFQARTAGIIAWITSTAGFAASVRSSLVVFGDAATTAHNILANETLFRLAFAGEMVATLYIVYTFLLYHLFKPVNRNLSLLAAFFSLVGIAISTLNSLFSLAPLVLLGGDPSLSVFSAEQLQTLALVFLKVHAQGYTIGMVLFGCYNALIGYLIFKSTFLPRLLGVFLALSGLCYLINCFASFLAPAFEAQLVPYILIPGITELVLALWLVVMGVNAQRWKEQAIAAGEAGSQHDNRAIE